MGDDGKQYLSRAGVHHTRVWPSSVMVTGGGAGGGGQQDRDRPSAHALALSTSRLLCNAHWFEPAFNAGSKLLKVFRRGELG